MNPGICYLYEYKNDQKLRNVGFMKVTPQYHSCILQINARGIPVRNGDTVSLLAFYENDSEGVAKPIETLPCGEKTIYARLSLTDSEYPGGKILDDLGGFLLKTEDGQYYAALSDNLSFDTGKVKLWAEAGEAMVSEEPAIEAASNANTETTTDVKAVAADESDTAVETTVTAESDTAAEANASEVIKKESVMEAESLEIFPSTAEETDTNENIYDVEESSCSEAVETENLKTSEDFMDSGQAEIPAVTPAQDGPDITNPNERFQDLWEEESEQAPANLTEMQPAFDENPQNRMEQPIFNENPQNIEEQPDEQVPHETVRKIQRSDLSVLPRKSWNLANNSFLMHGYHNYNHLLLVEEDGHYWLGVPGVYAPREARAAELFGFPQFTQTYANQMELNDDERDEDEKFGHWCRYIR